ncbi:putative methltransferase, enzyme of biotin synthesis [Magnetospirillum sp. XM-1]|uniref:methyltransferase domain-containing protein n=1 Tax=Magnetospirillum sp. XM-1 TaxID=1663591 RepID=UPI00073DD3A2|nr:methyltransferase domain-containing protein [Magnetospirillum sp. XM-1]CUW40631.1 putative methltransferase, enzyme of biotin synthesis [Magnetospirillum sp. XM-1]
MSRKKAIAGAFSAAAATYESAARAQVWAADALVERLGGLSAPVSVLELGCGTGLLTRRLAAALPAGSRILATDLSPAMVEAAATRLPEVSFAVMDAEAPHVTGPFDMIVSSLAAQWFADLPATLARLAALLTPGGRLLLVTLGAGTFAQWKDAHRALGLDSGVPDYPEAQALAAMLAGAQVESQPLTLDYADGRDFLKSLEALGAQTPKPGHRPLPPGQLRRIIKAMGKPCTVTWDILLLDYRV